ncbi:MAG: phosphoribosylaminoimidazolesuccinocarboxamide synthase [Defluviitaleaceae bacterium]|nr:phosphoribosylaminoimidazolesuccinocarboxamide synthase [Defluviitaleaceae bacterium]
MKLIYQGKTKDVYANDDGTITLKLKDDATGKDGVFDPGENAVGLSIEGLGRESLRLSIHYFELMHENNIPTHYISANLSETDISEAEMTVKSVKPFGVNNIEFICRRKADGSFLRRYGAYTSFGADLNYFVEVTLKDDSRQDPPISKDALVTLGIMTSDEYNTCEELTRKATKIIADDLEKKGLELFDIKFEFGKANGEIILIDEFSAGIMRVYKNGEKVAPLDLTTLLLDKTAQRP